MIKAEAQKIKPISKLPLSRKIPTVSFKAVNSTSKNKEMGIDDTAYIDDMDEDEEDEDDDDDEDDEYDDEDDEDDEDDPDHLYEDAIMNQCPKSCKCVGQYASATTAR